MLSQQKKFQTLDKLFNNKILLIRIRYDENILNVENKIKEQVYGRN